MIVASSAGGVAWPQCRRAAARRAGCRVPAGSGCRCAGGCAGGWSRAGAGLGAGCGVGVGAGACCVVLGCGCAVCGILRAWACGRVVFLGAVGGAWCFLRGGGVASVVVVVWRRVVYPPNKTCNAKTSYKYAILVLACKSLCGA